MAITEYIDSIERANWAKHGERASVKDFGAVSDGVADCSAAFQDAYDSMVAKGGGSIDIPGVGSAGMSYKINTPINLNSAVPVSFYGQGYSSKITRGGNLPAGKGLFNLVNAKHVLFRNFLVDGMVTASTGLLYSDFAGNPVNPTLTANTTFWVQGGEDIEWDGVYIEHTGGYAAYLDGVKGARFLRCILRNNRPHTMGTVVGDLNYGSPTGGIFYYNQGGVRVDGLTVRGCVFERNTGRCVWGTSASGTPHQQVHVDNNKFTDFGLEAVLLGYTVGGSVNGNSFRRGGYITGNDAGAGAPRRHPNFPSKAIATFGATRLVPCSDNSMVSINGTAIFGDGYGYGIIAGNSIRVPRSGDPEYAEDSIGSGFAAKAIGIELWNSQGQATGATGVSITGNTLDNLDGNAIGLHAARKCDAHGNLIIMAAGASSPPIVIGGTAGSNQNATENLITGNTIHYAPAAQAPAVFEDPAGRAFTAADQNNVFNNYCVGANVFEFQRDPNSISTAALFYTTSFVATSQSRHGVQREGTGEGSVLRWYAQDGDPWGWIHMGLQMYRAAGARCPLLNVSETGPGMDREGGCITTGKVTQLPYGDAMATSKLSVSGFLAMSDATYWEDDANLLPSVDIPDVQEGWALLRWNGLEYKWQQSVDGGGAQGPRVWTDFGSGGTAGNPAPPDQAVQFNNNGVFGGDPYFSYAQVTHQLTLFSFAYNGITMPNGGFLGENVNVTKYVSFAPRNIIIPAGADSFLGNTLLFSDSDLDRLHLVRGYAADKYEDYNLHLANLYASGTASNAIQAPSGGVTALTANFTHDDRLTVNVPNGGVNTKWITINELFALKEITPSAGYPPLSDPGEMRLYADVNHQLYMSTNGQPWGPFGGGQDAAGTDGDVQYNYGNGEFGANPRLNWDYDEFVLTVQTKPNQIGLAVKNGWIDSALGYATNTGSMDAVQAQQGGVHAKWLHANESLVFQQIVGGGPELSHDNETRLYASANGQMYISTNKAAWGPFGTGSGPAGAEGHIQFYKQGDFGASSNFYWDDQPTKQQLWVTTHAGQFGIQVTGGWVQAEGGFLTNNTSTDAIQAPSGGVKGKYLTFNQVTPVVGPPADPPLSGSGEARLANVNGQMYISTNTSVYQPFGSPAGGTNYVQYNRGGFFAAHVSFQWSEPSQSLLLYNEKNGYNLRIIRPSSALIEFPNTKTADWGFCAGPDGTLFLDQVSVVRMLTFVPYVANPLQVQTAAFNCDVSSVGKYYTDADRDDAFHASRGSFTGEKAILSESLVFKQRAKPALSGPGEVRIYASTDGWMYISTNTQDYGPFGVGGTGTPAGGNTHVQYNNMGAFGGSGNFTWDNPNQVLGLGMGTATDGGRIQTNSINDVYPTQPPGGPAARHVHFTMHRPYKYIWQMGIDSGSYFVIIDPMNVGSGGYGVFTSFYVSAAARPENVIAGTHGTLQAPYVNAIGGVMNALQAASGGVTAKYVVANESMVWKQITPTTGVPALSGAGEVRIYANSNGQLYISTNTAPYGPFGGSGGGGSAAGGTGDIQWRNASGGFGSNGDLNWDDGQRTLDLWGKYRVTKMIQFQTEQSWDIYSDFIPGAGATPDTRWLNIKDMYRGAVALQILANPSPSSILVYTQGYFQSGAGFYAAGYSYDQFRSATGGVSVESLRARLYTHVGSGWGIPTVTGGDTLVNGCMYHDNSTNTIRVKVGDVWRTIYTIS